MPQATQAAFDARIGADDETLIETRRPANVRRSDIRIAVHDDLAVVEAEWRAFEQVADGTVFQSFGWVSTWQRHIGAREGVRPAVVLGRDGGGLLFLLPLSIERGGGARRLTWHGTELCDYNGPLLAPDFAARLGAVPFASLWREIERRLQADPRFAFDVVQLDKMQRNVGAQANPFIELGVRPHANGAYLTQLGSEWEAFYAAKRSSATRRRDRTKRKRMTEIGEIRMISATTAADAEATLDTLMAQKSKSFAAMGVANIFERPGYRDFYRALAAQPDFVHVSRLEVGPETAAANMGLKFRGAYYHLLASYTDGPVAHWGPGAAHLHELMRYAIDQGCRVFDFTIGDERYKREWSDTEITLFDHVAAARLRGLPAALKLSLVGRAKHFIKQNPKLWEIAFKLRAALGPLRQRLGR